jgi:hypothetical protein
MSEAATPPVVKLDTKVLVCGRTSAKDDHDDDAECVIHDPWFAKETEESKAVLVHSFTTRKSAV